MRRRRAARHRRSDRQHGRVNGIGEDEKRHDERRREHQRKFEQAAGVRRARESIERSRQPHLHEQRRGRQNHSDADNVPDDKRPA